MKIYCIATIVLFLILSNSCGFKSSPDAAYLTLTSTPFNVSVSIEASATQTLIPMTVTPVSSPELLDTPTPIPAVLPTATPMFEAFQPITVENSKFAQIVYKFLSSLGNVEIYDLEFSPLGSSLAVVNELGELQMWLFPRAGRKIALQDYQLDTIQGSEGKIMGVAFSPDGSNIASVESSELFSIRDQATGAILTRQITGIYGDDLVYSPDGSILAIAGDKWDGKKWKEFIQLWSISDTRLITTLDDFPSWWMEVCSLAISSDSAVLAAGFCDYHIKIWDLKNEYQYLGNVIGQYAFECYSHCPFPTNTVAFLPNRKILASGTDNPGIPLIDIFTGRLYLQMDTIRAVTRDTSAIPDVTDIAFSPDGTFLAIAAGQEIQVRSTKTGDLLTFFETPEDYVTKISFSPDGFLIAVGSIKGNIYIIGVKD